MSFLRDLQMQVEQEGSVSSTRKVLNEIVEFFMNKEDQEHALDVILNIRRGLPVELAKDHKIFFVDDEMKSFELPEHMQHESYGMVKYGNIVYSGRLVYSVMDTNGDVMGFCGWDEVELPKYLDSKNAGYKAKANVLYGMEKLKEYYSNNKPVYVVEGIVCCLYLRSKGLQALATLGSHMTPYVIEILKRFGNRLVVIPDNDTKFKTIEELNDTKLSGESFVKQAKRELPKARIVQSTVAKDVDDTRLYEDHKYEEQFLKELALVAVNPFMMYQTLQIRR